VRIIRTGITIKIKIIYIYIYIYIYKCVYLAASVCEVEPEMLGNVFPGSIGVAYCSYKCTHKCS
jgi:hypothetical protein